MRNGKGKERKWISLNWKLGSDFRWKWRLKEKKGKWGKWIMKRNEKKMEKDGSYNVWGKRDWMVLKNSWRKKEIDR